MQSLAEKFIPRSWQEQILGNPKKNLPPDRTKFKVVVAHRKAGKYLSIDTEIPLADGSWKRIEDIRVGDKIFNEQGQPCVVTDVFPIEYEKPCYRLTFNDGTEIVCSDDHRWLTQTKLDRASGHRGFRRVGTIKTTEEIAETIRYQGESNHSIQLARPLRYECPSDDERNRYLPPYFLGLWLGDGTTRCAAITTMDEEIVWYISDIAKQFGCTVKKYRNFRLSRAHTYGLTGNGQIHKRLRNLGVLENKHIPRAYLYAGYRVRLSLLQGIMDTDGCVTKHGRECELVTKSERLADDYAELILGLGHQIRRKTKNIFGRTYHRIFFRPRVQVFNLRRKAKKLRLIDGGRNSSRFIVSAERVPSVPVRCLTVNSENHLYLCTRSLIPTHNTVMALMHLFMQAWACEEAMKRNNVRVPRFTYIGPTYKQAKDIAWDLMKSIVPAGMLLKRPNETNLEIRLTNRVIMNIKGADKEDSLRGPGLYFALMDEFSYMKPHIWSQIIQPELGATGGGAMFIGTPNGRDHFYNLYTLGRDLVNPDWGSWKLPSTEPTFGFEPDTPRGAAILAPGTLEEAKAQSPERHYRQEWECAFLDNAGMVFDRIEENVVDEFREFPETGHRYRIGLDPAMHEDWSAFVVVDLTDHKVKYVYRTNKIDAELLFARTENMVNTWTTNAGRPEVVIDATGMGDPIYDILAGRGVPISPVKFSALSKRQMVDNLAILFNKDAIKIPRCDWLIDELKDYRFERLPSGRFRYGAPSGKHDDGCTALMLAYWQIPPMQAVVGVRSGSATSGVYNRFTGCEK